jgi:hypothetical protein
MPRTFGTGNCIYLAAGESGRADRGIVYTPVDLALGVIAEFQ